MPDRSSAPSWATHADGIARNSTDVIILLARISLVVLFYFSLSAKLPDIDGFIAKSLTARGVPFSTLVGYAAIAMEMVGGLTVLFGFGTRYAALLMIVFCIVAAFIGHRYWDVDPAQFLNQRTHFYKNLGMVGGFLLLFMTGGGRYSLDHLLASKR